MTLFFTMVVGLLALASMLVLGIIVSLIIAAFIDILIDMGVSEKVSCVAAPLLLFALILTIYSIGSLLVNNFHILK